MALEILACLGLFLAAASVLRSRARRHLFTRALLTGALLQMALLILLESAGDPSTPRPGLLEQPGSLAIWLGLALFVAFGGLWGAVLTSSDRGVGATDPAERYERRVVPIVARAAAWLAVATGIALTRSSAALLCATATTLVLAPLALLHQRQTLTRRGLGVAAVAMTLAFAVGAATAVLPGSSAAFESSATIRQLSVQAWRQFPVVGSGLGSFPEAFRRVQPRELKGLIEDAHSDPLQILVTGGATGLAITLILVGSLFAVLMSGWRNQRHRQESAAALGGVGALLFLVADGLFEFNLSAAVIPGALSAVLGSAWAAIRAHGNQVR